MRAAHDSVGVQHSGNRMYPLVEPYDVQNFAVGDGHVLYLEQSGNPQGIPVVYLHGGPGSGWTVF